MPYGKGTYGKKRGRPSAKAKAAGRKKMTKKVMAKKGMPKMKKKMR
ncbi:MAG: hypothetical protein Unbinned3338contig1000_23 [Prokaryotic dsDNA virus sp.]|mgnify:CR=1 FL=1|nr:MAG: hypothetical protein Unbinned3338contig1000_23 [Prokaryotic dsDNA virus sp.]|tara:strand:+ start:498 stop:635 length:138 start_codon:yes stop_codon:yes gene_type:complete